jgi:hypothetical protein
MKMNKSLLAVALGLSVAGLSQAGEIYLTGSTAMRSTIYSTLMAPGAVFQSTPVFTGYGGKGGGDDYMAFVGTLVGGSGQTIINCSWSGSEDGIQHLATGDTQTFMADSLIQTGSSVDNAASTPPTTQAHACDLAMADNAQSFSRSRTPSLTGQEVGVITFEWIRNKGLWTGTNVTDSMIQQALAGGALRGVFTGNPADNTDLVYVSGRDAGSGTRVNAFGDSGFGILTTPAQIQLDSTGHMIDQGGGVYIGDYGFTSGGTLATTMGSDTTAIADPISGAPGFSAIAYAGVGDADAGVAAGATVLSYNGVPFSTNAVYQGTYTFWGNEYIYKANSVATGSEADKTYNNVLNNVATYCDGRKAVALTTMQCSRPGPTAPPQHN